MLTMFYKAQDDELCDCEIISFADRIWIEQDESLICIRTFAIRLSETSQPLQKLRMLIPYENISDFRDLSSTLLDSNYKYNNYARHGYEMLHMDCEKDRGQIKYDGLECDVSTLNKIMKYDHPSESCTCQVLALDFERHPIQPGKTRMVRISFTIKKALKNIFQNTYNLVLNYFYDRCGKRIKGQCDHPKKLEIKVRTILDSETLQGGFDIFLYSPNFSTNFLQTKPSTTTTSSHLPDGKESEQKFYKYIWRARKIFPAYKHLEFCNTKICIESVLHDPYELNNLQDEVSNIRKEGERQMFIAKASVVLSAIAIMLAVALEIW